MRDDGTGLAGRAQPRYSRSEMAARTTQTGQEIDPLFAAPLPDFIRARNALADRLKATGRADEAAKVLALKKPSAAVWAINQLARGHPDVVQRIVSGVGKLGTASGEGGGPSGRQQLLRPAVARAEQIMKDAGVTASPEMLDRLATTLFAAAVNPDARADLLAGRLPDELALPGFELFAGKAPAIGPRPPGGRQAPRSTRREQARVEHAQAALETARKDVKRLEDDAIDLEKKARSARRAADEAAEAAATARERAQRGLARVRDADAALAEAEEALRRAGHA
jgi:hypothetical protein